MAIKLKPVDRKKIKRARKASRYGNVLSEFIKSNEQSVQLELEAGASKRSARAQLAGYAKRHKLPVDVFTGEDGEVYMERTDQ